MKIQDINRTVNELPGLVDIHGLIKAIWGDTRIAPCTRTIDRLRERGKIPYVKLGHLIYFSPPAVVEAITRQHTVQSRRSRPLQHC